jgi:hypothetical protein
MVLIFTSQWGLIAKGIDDEPAHYSKIKFPQSIEECIGKKVYWESGKQMKEPYVFRLKSCQRWNRNTGKPCKSLFVDVSDTFSWKYPPDEEEKELDRRLGLTGEWYTYCPSCKKEFTTIGSVRSPPSEVYERQHFI